MKRDIYKQQIIYLLFVGKLLLIGDCKGDTEGANVIGDSDVIIIEGGLVGLNDGQKQLCYAN